jgi:sulfite exporter TauE/SafE/copper chaperone CopZ
MSNKVQTIKVFGLHCQSCKTLIETEIKEFPGVKSVLVDLNRGICDLEFDREKTPLKKINQKIKELGYGPESEEEKPGNFNLWLGLLTPLTIVGLLFAYYWFSSSGAFSVLAKLNEKNLGYGLIFLIGFLASFHCVGMCGGLVVAYSAGIEASGKKFHKYFPHLLYNAGRIISYTLVGAILGGIGSFFAVTPLFSGILMILAGGFMLLMALNLVTNLTLLQKINSILPQTIAKYIFNQKNSQKSKGPLAIGLLTGLMPCGPLQAMQLYALGSGSAVQGGLSLLFYALGTVPLMFGFGAIISSIIKKYMNKMLKISAVIVGILAVVMIARGFAGIQGTLPASQSGTSGNIIKSGNFQEVRMAVTRYGYQPNVLYIKKGVPVRWVIDGSGISGCTNAIQIPSLNIKKSLTRGENVIEFTPTQTGELPFSCWMQMVWGKFIVQ